MTISFQSATQLKISSHKKKKFDSDCNFAGLIRVEQILRFCGIIVLRSPIFFLIMTTSPFKVKAKVALNHRKRTFYNETNSWPTLALAVSLLSGLAFQSRTPQEKKFPRIFSPFCKIFETMTCIFSWVLFGFQKLHSSFFVTFLLKFLLQFFPMHFFAASIDKIRIGIRRPLYSPHPLCGSLLVF